MRHLMHERNANVMAAMPLVYSALEMSHHNWPDFRNIGPTRRATLLELH